MESEKATLLGLAVRSSDSCNPHLAFFRCLLCSEDLSISYLSSQTLEGEIHLSSFFFFRASVTEKDAEVKLKHAGSPAFTLLCYRNRAVVAHVCNPST